jgi:hypothetical protein
VKSSIAKNLTTSSSIDFMGYLGIQPDRTRPTERSPTERGPTERSPTERGPTERGPTERGPTERGPTELFQLPGEDLRANAQMMDII